MPRDDGARPISDRIRLLHMLEAAEQAASFITGRQRADLDTDAMLRRALKDCIQEIGGAAAKVSDAVRNGFRSSPGNKSWECDIALCMSIMTSTQMHCGKSPHAIFQC